METLHFDFTKDATRTSICQQLGQAMDDSLAGAVSLEAARAGVPDKHHHNIAEVYQTIDKLVISDDAKADMRAIYTLLAEAEAQAHGCDVSETHFHEVGEGARIANTLLVCLAIEALMPKRITATAVQTGSGTVEVAHGTMNVPTPATAAILAQGIPTCDELLEGELCTPTSAAIIKHFVDEFV